MISQRQLANRRETITRNIEEFTATTIQFPENTHTNIACARWSVSSGSVTDGLAGLLKTYDVAFRIRKALIPEGLTIVENRTRISEDGIIYRVERQRRAKGCDPAIVLECKAL